MTARTEEEEEEEEEQDMTMIMLRIRTPSRGAARRYSHSCRHRQGRRRRLRRHC